MSDIHQYISKTIHDTTRNMPETMTISKDAIGLLLHEFAIDVIAKIAEANKADIEQQAGGIRSEPRDNE